MFAALGVGAFVGGIFHLMTHAFFKALLFLGSGSVIMAMHHEQDMMKMGGLRKHLPWTYRTMLVGTLAIAGVPGLAGFFSKDEILWRAWSNGHPVIWLLLWLGAGMTAFYMFRLLFLTFWGEERMDEHTRHHIHESPKNVVYPLAALAVLSVIGGYVGLPGLDRDGQSIRAFPGAGAAGCRRPAHAVEHSAGQELLFTGLSVAIALVGIFLAYRFYVASPGHRGPGYRTDQGLLSARAATSTTWTSSTTRCSSTAPKIWATPVSSWTPNSSTAPSTAPRPRRAAPRRVSGFFDKYVVDGLVNLVGWINMRLNRIATSLPDRACPALCAGGGIRNRRLRI